VIAGPVPTPDKRGVADVGLDGLLTDYGMTLGRKYVLSQPAQELDAFLSVAVLADNLDRNSLLWREFGRERREFVMPLAREVIVSPTNGPGGKAEPLMVSYPNRLTWLESEIPTSLERSYSQVVRDPEVRVAKQAELGGTRVLAASYSEAGKAKVAVFGCGYTFRDDNPQGPEAASQLFSVTVNWLREQPPVANIAAKTYGFYSPDRKLDVFRAGVLPVLMGSLLTAALGVGVYIIRRK